MSDWEKGVRGREKRREKGKKRSMREKRERVGERKNLHLLHGCCPYMIFSSSNILGEEEGEGEEAEYEREERKSGREKDFTHTARMLSVYDFF